MIAKAEIGIFSQTLRGSAVFLLALLSTVDVFAEHILYSEKLRESTLTLTFGENSDTCAADCSGITGFCGDDSCNAAIVTLNIGEEKGIVVDGASIKISLVSLTGNQYEIKIEGPGKMHHKFIGQGSSFNFLDGSAGLWFYTSNFFLGYSANQLARNYVPIGQVLTNNELNVHHFIMMGYSSRPWYPGGILQCW